MSEKIVQVGVFWAIPDRDFKQRLLEFHKGYYTSEADSNGFINYLSSHYDVWNDEVRGLGDDCYKYPRGRVLYNANSGKHRIFADKCILPSTIEEVAKLFDIENYELCYDEHYVCSGCAHNQNKHSTLEYSILRGKDKIGENLIEISCGDTKILVELGKALDGDDEQFEQGILQKSYSAVVVSHYHEDHAGLIKYKRDCPVYIGNGAYRIVNAMSEFHSEELPQNIKTYRNGRTFKVGGIKITPYLCDHSAYDSYMLLFEANGQSILYTGDFRFHGRKDKDKLLSVLPKSVDVLIHEGTNIGQNSCCMTEAELENKAVEVMRATENPVFVLQSSTNIDRLVSIYRASKKSGRFLYMDNYTSLIAAAAGGSIPRPDIFNDVIAFTPHPVCGKRKDMFFEIENKRRLNNIASGSKRFTMLVRPTMLGYLKKLLVASNLKEATLIYSMWQGYKERDYMVEFLTELQKLGVQIIDLHTSGHASSVDLELLKQMVKSKHTVCVHTNRLQM